MDESDAGTGHPRTPPAPRDSTPPAMDRACCEEREVVALVRRFYERVPADGELGPIFERHVHDWDAHHAQLVDFWSALLRGTRRFRGSPVTTHLALPGVTPGLFAHWLDLFRRTTAESGNRALQREADQQAALIAGRLWQRYREAHGDAGSVATGDEP